MVGKPESTRKLGSRWVDTINMDLGEIGRSGMHWLDLVQGRDQWKYFMNTVMNLRVP
jgi:hypothetical protein